MPKQLSILSRRILPSEEDSFRRGFSAALEPTMRGRSFDAAMEDLKAKLFGCLPKDRAFAGVSNEASIIIRNYPKREIDRWSNRIISQAFQKFVLAGS